MVKHSNNERDRQDYCPLSVRGNFSQNLYVHFLKYSLSPGRLVVDLRRNFLKNLRTTYTP